jgi:hypothetical protein
MKEKPILFSGEMVRAILEGRKSQTRRVVKVRGVSDDVAGWLHYMARAVDMECPYGKPGDRLWVRETWLRDGDVTIYKADLAKVLADSWNGHWRPSIYMPRAASRIALEVIKVRVERVQDISHNDACIEGAPSEPELNDYGTGSIYIDWYANLWDKLNAKRGYGWKVNPWVWVVEFKQVNGGENAK